MALRQKWGARARKACVTLAKVSSSAPPWCHGNCHAGVGQSDPYLMCYDPLAMLFHMQPDAFTLEEERVAVMVTGDTSTADEWRFERCPKDAREDAQAFVVEPKAVSLERYAAFLRQASL